MTMARLLWQWWPLLLGNGLEWYEFSAYGYVAAQMKANFFGGSSAGMWVGFAITFLLRPVGGIAFGWLADRIGRRASAFCSMLGMLVATFVQGLLPGRVCCGRTAGRVGMVVLLAMRMLQGLCTGGEVGPVTAYLGEAAPPGRTALCTVLFLCTAVIAFCISSGLVAFLAQTLGPDKMLEWGWRVPFLLSLPPGLLALWGRRKLPESPAFPEVDVQSDSEGMTGSSTDSDVLSTVDDREARPSILNFYRAHFPALMIGFWATVACSGAWYMSFFCSTSFVAHAGLSQAETSRLSSLAMVVTAVVGVFGSWWTDTYLGSDPWPVVTGGALILALTGMPLFGAFENSVGDAWTLMLYFSLAYGAVMGLALSQAYLFCLDLFPAKVRALGFGLTINLAMSYVGGTASLVGQALADISPKAPGVYLSCLGLVSFCTLLLTRLLRSQGLLPRHPPGELAFAGPAKAEVSDGAGAAPPLALAEE